MIRPGPKSECEPFREIIVTKIEQGLTAQRIYQDLVVDHGFTAKYPSVRRFVAKLVQATELPCPSNGSVAGRGSADRLRYGGPGPASQRQVTPALGVPHCVVPFAQGLQRSGLASEHRSVYRRVGERFSAFWVACPKTLVIDNLKAAVKRGDWYDPEVHPKLQSFAQHYGTVFLPTKPYTPEHKGKIESGVKYVKNNALKGRKFSSLEEQNAFLRDWETNVADTRIHGTTKRQVRKQFEEIERETLMPLPVERFPFFHESRRAVHRDGHVEVAKAYYSVPPEYVGRRLWVRWDSRLVRIFNDRWEQLAVHAKAEPGRFRTNANHIPKEKVSAVERGTDALLRQVAAIGPHTRQWSQAMTQARGIEGVRVLVGLKALAAKHETEALEDACKKALDHGAYRLRTIRELIKRRTSTQQQFDFLEEHPVIRPLSDYSLDSLLQFRKERTHERETL